MALDHKLRCDELVERVTDYLEGALSPRERELLEQHIVICRGCATYLEQLRTTMLRSSALAASEPLPDAELQSLLECFRKRCS